MTRSSTVVVTVIRMSTGASATEGVLLERSATTGVDPDLSLSSSFSLTGTSAVMLSMMGVDAASLGLSKTYAWNRISYKI